jgi:DNA-binding winged helix-turn-helix (wHTH) protein
VLIRAYRGVIRDGAHDRLLRELHDHVLPWFNKHPGALSTTIAFGLEEKPDECLVETRWRSVGDMIRFMGEDWRTPRVQPWEECLVSVSAHHYLADDIGPAPATHSGESPSLMSVGGVEIDGRRLRVAWNGSAVHLPPREMAAMLALASDLGAPVNSKKLARHIWPGSEMVGAYDVRRIVHRLRILLLRSGTPLLIRNVHGLGYGLELKEQEPVQPRQPTPHR